MENPTFRLEGVVKSKEEMLDFEGPLTLILMLLSKNKIEIRDIKIAEILDQYLAWLDRMQKMDLDVASEFVQMASQLVYIKTKTLLAGTEEISELELLMSSLEQLKSRDAFQAVKENIPQMAQALQRGALLFSTPQEPIPKYGEYSYRHRPWELMAALASMLQKGAPVSEEEDAPGFRAIPRPIVYSVRDKGRQLISYLRQNGQTALQTLYAMAATKSELVATFISLLEMCAMGSVVIRDEQGRTLVSFVGGDTEEILESMDYG